MNNRPNGLITPATPVTLRDPKPAPSPDPVIGIDYTPPATAKQLDQYREEIEAHKRNVAQGVPCPTS